MDKIQIGRPTWDIRANREYDTELYTEYNDPQLEEKLKQWCEEHTYWEADLFIGGRRYDWPDPWDDRVLKPKYVLKHILYCIDLHKAFYEVS